MTEEEARLAIMGAISMELKNPTLQQGFEIICKNLADLEKENAELRAKESFVGDQNRKLCEQQQKIEVLEAEVNRLKLNEQLAVNNGKNLLKENAELKKQLTELKEFYEIEYFQIADRTADEKIKELEKHQVEATVDDYSPYDENTWGDMHEEWFVPKEEVRDLLKENYALIIKAKEIIKELVRVEYADFTNGDYSNELSKVLEQAEQFLKECK
jgi:hypothetical protein